MEKSPRIPEMLNGEDALHILRIVWGWIEDTNNGTGGDVDDLMHDLTTSGYDPEWIEGS